MDADELLGRIRDARDYANTEADRLADEGDRDQDAAKRMHGASYRTIAEVLGRILPPSHRYAPRP